jgi:hypothetical protein
MTTDKVLNTTPAPKARKINADKLPVADLAAARKSYIDTMTSAAKAADKAYGAGTLYAAMLTREFGKGWEKIASTPASKRNGNEKKIGEKIDAEKKVLRETLKARKYPEKGLDVPWSRTRKVASEITSGLRYEKDGAIIPGKSKPKGASNKRDIVTRTKEDLSALFKALHATEGLPVKAAHAERFIKEALLALGVDTATLIKVDA